MNMATEWHNHISLGSRILNVTSPELTDFHAASIVNVSSSGRQYLFRENTTFMRLIPPVPATRSSGDERCATIKTTKTTTPELREPSIFSNYASACPYDAMRLMKYFHLRPNLPTNFHWPRVDHVSPINCVREERFVAPCTCQYERVVGLWSFCNECHTLDVLFVRFSLPLSARRPNKRPPMGTCGKSKSWSQQPQHTNTMPGDHYHCARLLIIV